LVIALAFAKLEVFDRNDVNLASLFHVSALVFIPPGILLTVYASGNHLSAMAGNALYFYLLLHSFFNLCPTLNKRGKWRQLPDLNNRTSSKSHTLLRAS